MRLTVTLAPVDVDGQPLRDPAVFVRLARPDGVGTVSVKIALAGAPVRFAVDDGPPGPSVLLRVGPSRYRDGLAACDVDGSGLVSTPPMMLPRQPGAWRPDFVSWRTLPAAFDRLKEVLAVSLAFQVGLLTEPVQFVGDAYDAIPPDDESRLLAKMALLNLYARLQREVVPGATTPWFSFVRECRLATRERVLATVADETWQVVRDLADHPQSGYRRSKPDLHVKNFKSVPGVSTVDDVVSVKSGDDKANLQVTVARVQAAGGPLVLLDADMDENGKLLLHTFNLVTHLVTKGTHPVDIHECLKVMFPGLDVGYCLEPRVPIGEVSARVVSGEELAGALVAPRLPPVSRMAVLGDSVTWGQGLLEPQKMHALVAAAVGRAGSAPDTRMLAHSGAVIGVHAAAAKRAGVDGEVPTGYPTILEQCESYPQQDADLVDLVIVNGGINDVDIRFILSPLTEPEDLADTTARACGPDLEVLLRRVAARFSRAYVVTVGYYPILSRQSGFGWGHEFLDAAGAPPPGLGTPEMTARFPLVWDRVVENCQVFAAESTRAITRAVDAVNDELNGPRRLAAAVPPFTDANAALAPESWLFGINIDFSPQDPVAADRHRACDRFERDPIRRQQCYRASVGHPNALGAKAFAREILASLAAIART